MTIDDPRIPPMFEQMDNDDHIDTAEGELNQGGLIPSIRVDHVLGTRREILGLVEEGLNLLLAADELAVASGFDSHWKAICASFDGSDRWLYEGQLKGHLHDPVSRQVGQVSASVDAGGWDLLLRQTGLRTFMDAESRADWDEAVYRCKTPTLDIDNIQATFQRLYDDRGIMVEQGVIQLFRSLSWDYRSNTPVMFGKRLVMKRTFEPREPGWRGPERSWYPSAYACNHIDDLVRQLRYFDGLPEHDHRNSSGRWLNEPDITGAPWEEYFELRRFNNGNAHILFKRLDLVEKLNGILAKHFPGALPAPQGGKS